MRRPATSSKVPTIGAISADELFARSRVRGHRERLLAQQRAANERDSAARQRAVNANLDLTGLVVPVRPPPADDAPLLIGPVEACLRGTFQIDTNRI